MWEGKFEKKKRLPVSEVSGIGGWAILSVSLSSEEEGGAIKEGPGLKQSKAGRGERYGKEIEVNEVLLLRKTLHPYLPYGHLEVLQTRARARICLAQLCLPGGEITYSLLCYQSSYIHIH